MADVVRNLTIRATTEGVQQAATALGQLTQAQESVARSADVMSQVTDTASRRQISAATSLERVRRTVDDTHRAQARLADTERQLGRAVDQGLVSLQERDRLLSLAAQKFGVATQANDNFARSTGLAAHQVGNLRSQLFDVATSLQGGASPLTVLSQQGPQIYEALAGQQGISAGLKALGTSALAMLNPVVVGSAAIVAAGAGVALAYRSYAAGQEELRKALAGTGKLTDQTVESVNRMAPAWAAAAKVSTGSAREMAVVFAATGKIQGSTVGDLIATTKQFARATGTDLPDATKAMAQAFADPVAGALELNKSFAFLDAGTLSLIQRLDAAGNRTAAQATLLAAVKPAIADVAGETNAWALAWDKVKNAALGAYDATGKAIYNTMRPPTAVEKMVDLQRRRDANVNGTEGDYVEELRRSGLTDPQIQSIVPTYQPGANASARPGEVSLDDQLSYAQEDRRRAGALSMSQGRNADAAAKSLVAKGVIEEITPTEAELLRLTKFKTGLEEALAAGNAPSGTEAALKRVTELLNAGGAAALALRTASQDAFNQAALLPYQKGLAEIEAKYRELEKSANGNKALLDSYAASKALDVAAFRTGQTVVPLRDARFRAEEQVATADLLSKSLFMTTETAAAASTRQDLLNDARRRGIAIDGDYAKGIEEIAAASGRAAKAQEEAQRVRDRVVGGMDELRSGTSSSITGIFSDLRQGKNPLQSLISGFGRMTDQFVERMVSRPLTEAMFGQFGKAGGGMFGDDLSKVFASGITTPMANVTASVVNVNGGIGTGGSAGTVAGGAATQAAEAAAGRGSGGTLTSVATAPIGKVVTAPLTQAAEAASSPAGTAGRVGVQLGGGSDTTPTQVALMPKAIVANDNVVSQAAMPLFNILPQKNPRLTQEQLEVRVRDAEMNGSLFGGWDGPDQSTVRRMQGPLLQKADELAQVAEKTTGALGQVGEGATGLAGKLADVVSQGGKIGGQLPGMGSSGINFGGGGGGSSFVDDTAGLAGIEFSEGGFTGHGGKYAPAGVVHRGEYVMSAAATRRLGVPWLERVHQGARGYAEGGPVGMAPVGLPQVAMPTTYSTSTGPSFTDARVFSIDAKGSTMGEAQFREILNQALTEKDRELNRNWTSRSVEANRRYG